MVKDLEHRRQKTDLAPEPTDFSWTKWSGLHALGGPTRRIHSRRTSPTPPSITPSPRFRDQEIKIQRKIRTLARYFVPSLLQFLRIHIQWIPSHINIAGNEIADSLARAGASETTTPAAPLTYLELFSKYKAKNKAIWMILPVHPWYQSECHGGSFVRGSSRRDQTALTRFLRGHLISLTFVDGIKRFEICTKCSFAQASPRHILSCFGLTR
ncbi:RNase H domain-containing protein [Trichonephila clavipes]|nr:RNase H domain-containing protein [Trichonephila clavipes]